MAWDIPGVTLDDTADMTPEQREELRRRRPGMPPVPLSAPQTARPETSTTSPVPTAGLPPVPSQPTAPAGTTPTKPTGMFDMPAYKPGPAEQAEEAYRKQGADQLAGRPGWKKFLDVLGQFAVPTLEKVIPGSQGYYDAKLGKLGGAAEEERGRVMEEAKLGEQQAKATQERAKAESLLHPPAKAAADHTVAPESDLYYSLIDQGVPPEDALKRAAAAAAKPTADKPDTETEEAQRYEKIETARGLKQPISPEDAAWEEAYKKRKTLAPALTANIKAGEQNTSRSDKSYQYISGRIDKLRQPVEERLARMSRLEDTLAQGTPQADALVAPELLTVMAGGQGSGLRMNEAEIARIVGGRTQWESIKSKIQAWQTDPNKGFALTPPQREQVRKLISAVNDRIHAKMQAIDEESENLLNSDNPQDHRKIYNRLQKRLSDADRGQSTAGTSGGTALPTGGAQAAEGAQRTNKRTGEVQEFRNGQWQTVTPGRQQ